MPRSLADSIELQADGTTLYYERHAAVYAAETLHADLARETQLLTTRLAVNSTVLDLGCGGAETCRDLGGPNFDPHD